MMEVRVRLPSLLCREEEFDLCGSLDRLFQHTHGPGKTPDEIMELRSKYGRPVLLGHGTQCEVGQELVLVIPGWRLSAKPFPHLRGGIRQMHRGVKSIIDRLHQLVGFQG